MKLPNANASAPFSHPSNVRDELFDLILAEILAKGRHFVFSFRDDLSHLRIGRLLRLSRAQIAHFQRLTLRRIAAPVRAVADGAFGLKEGCGVVSRGVDHLRLS